MATRAKKPPRARRGKGAAPKPKETRQNLRKPDPSAIVALNFKVPADFKRDFKIAAATYGMTQSAILKEAFALWQRAHGG